MWDWDDVSNLLDDFAGDVADTISDTVSGALKSFWDWDDVSNLGESMDAASEAGGSIAKETADTLSDKVELPSGAENWLTEESGMAMQYTPEQIDALSRIFTSFSSKEVTQDWGGLGSDTALGKGFMDVVKDKDPNLLSRAGEWLKSLSTDEKKILGMVFSGITAAAAQKMKGDNDVELANTVSRNRMAELDHKLSATAASKGSLPFGAPAQSRKLKDRAGNEVKFPQIPQTLAQGIIGRGMGGMYG